jgi:phosphoglycerol transferase MdoB-like AlkP superfamily enzyme
VTLFLFPLSTKVFIIFVAMQHWKTNFISLLKHIAVLLLLYFICRILFYCFNYSYFSNLHLVDLLSIMFGALRFDLSVIVLSNSAFIILYLLPFAFREAKSYRTLLKSLFITVNSLAILANCVDLVYFEFTLKRSTADVLNFFGGGMGNDLGRLLPLFLKEYWYVFFIWGGLTYLLYYMYRKIEKNVCLTWGADQYNRQVLVFIISMIISAIAYRGGFQLKPISTVDAGEYTSVKYVPLLVSTPFTILKTLDVEAIEPTIYYSNENELKSIYTPFHKGKSGGLKKLNVFIIALESFSKEYIGAINGRKTGYTPFLDSLIGQSLTFVNAFSNGKTSIQGIPSIVASIPSWMNEPYITSIYGSNQISSLAVLLKQEGYTTSFFHGGTNGTMGFNAFSKLAGYDNYFGRTEYNNEKEYDGNWGIWDEEFLQYTANTINQQKQPFCATVFTLTSHHPYPVPDKYKGKFKEGDLPIEHSIGYSDYALRKFFETAKKMPWFNNTLFVLSADHTGISSDDFYSGKVGNNAIPIIYYLPNSNLKRLDSTTTQQIDIVPSVLDYLNYPSPYFAFGKSVFDTTAQHHALTYSEGIYQLIENNYALEFDGTKAKYLYNYRTDSLLNKNLVTQQTTVAKQMEQKIKAIIQTYQQSLINNKMH